MPQIKAGHVIHVLAHFVKPTKKKYLICACPKRIKYLVVNSDPYQLALAAQFPFKKADAPWLDHDSWIDTAKLVTLTAMETQYVIDADGTCLKAELSANVRAAIKAFIGGHGIMPNDQAKIVGENF